jgi:DNA polymerase-3 subunit delta
VTRLLLALIALATPRPDREAVVGDTAERQLDDLTQSLAEGDVAGLLRDLARARGEGTAAISILRAAARHMQRLHPLRGFMAEGQDTAEAVKHLRPPVFWKAAAPLARQAERWDAPRLAAALNRLLEAESACKTTGAPADLLAERALVEVAARAAATRRRGMR